MSPWNDLTHTYEDSSHQSVSVELGAAHSETFTAAYDLTQLCAGLDPLLHLSLDLPTDVVHRHKSLKSVQWWNKISLEIHSVINLSLYTMLGPNRNRSALCWLVTDWSAVTQRKKSKSSLLVVYMTRTRNISAFGTQSCRSDLYLHARPSKNLTLFEIMTTMLQQKDLARCVKETENPLKWHW